MPNSRGEERRRRSDMPGTQAVRVIFRSRPWSGTARAATPRAGSGSRARPEPDRVGGCVWPAVTFPQPGLAEGPLPLQRGRVKGAPRPFLSTPGSPNPRLAHGPVRCLCVSVRVHQIPRLHVCVCARMCACVWASSLSPSAACVRVRVYFALRSRTRRRAVAIDGRADGFASQLNPESARSHHYNNNPGASASRW